MTTTEQSPDCGNLESATEAGVKARAEMVKEPVVGKESLMPYEAVAKAIFVKANGLSAYYRATGIARCAEDAV